MFTNDSYWDLLQNNLGVGGVGVLREEELMRDGRKGLLCYSLCEEHSSYSVETQSTPLTKALNSSSKADRED